MKAIAYVSILDPITGRNSEFTHIVVEAATVDELHDAAYDKLADMCLIDDETNVGIKLEFIGGNGNG